jgi:hypothetical protein
MLSEATGFLFKALELEGNGWEALYVGAFSIIGSDRTGEGETKSEGVESIGAGCKGTVVGCDGDILLLRGKREGFGGRSGSSVGKTVDDKFANSVGAGKVRSGFE